MSRGWKIGLGIAAGVVGLNVALSALGSLFGGTPGGPTSSSYATGGDGLAAYASLLRRAGHPVHQVRELPSRASLDPATTVVVLDPPFVTGADGEALSRFVQDGGRLITGGAASMRWLSPLLERAPSWSSGGISAPMTLAPVPELDGVGAIRTAADGSWDDAGSALPALGGTDGSVLAVAAAGEGRVLVLADPSILQNRLLGDADNARLALALAGDPSRPVAFIESYHGYGPKSGFAAIPGGWRFAFFGILAAALLFMVARGRRLGPPEETERELPPPRAAYVESLARVVARARRPAEALAPLRRASRAAVAGRSRLPADASDDDLALAAAHLGLTPSEIDAMLARGDSAGDVLAAGRAYVRAGARSGGSGR